LVTSIDGIRSVSTKTYIKMVETDYGLQHEDIDSMTDDEIIKHIEFLYELDGK